MLVSVIIPTFNRQNKVINAVQSVLKQSYKNIELIVVDDGSEDNTLNKLKGLSDPRIKIISQPHKGVSAARNKGISQSKANIIALLDSDDIWLPDKLKKHLKFHLEGGWQISQTDELWIKKGKKINPMFKHRKKAGWIFEPSLELCLISPSCVMFSKEVWEKTGGFDENLPACEDYDLWLRCSLKYSIGFLPEKLVVKYGGHPDQLSSKIIGLDLYRIYSLLKLLKPKNISKVQKEKIKNTLFKKGNLYIKGCLKRGKFEEAERIKLLIEKWIT